MKKKVLILGPIGDFGGRDVEANIIAKSLEDNYQVTILSTIFMTINSFALKDLSKTKWKSIYKTLWQSNPIIAFLSLCSKIVNKGSLSSYAYINNSLTKRFYSMDRLLWKHIEDEIKNAETIILCVQLTTKFFPEIVNYCSENDIPCFVRTTGTIREINTANFEFLKKVTLFIHHSETNAENLNKQLRLPYIIIDQCALNENKLLSLINNFEKPLKYGYLGRLSEEKGILPLTNYFNKLSHPFIIAGDGPQKGDILKVIHGNKYCEYVGLIGINEIADFFKKIDVLVIPSHEETGPLVGLEAMAAGKLIISTKVGAMADRFSNLKSFWFDIENVSSLQDRINEIESLKPQEFNSLSIANRVKYKEEYSFHAIALKYQNIISCE
jgi:glycosyltransferase involved in cell wall biosynthesis